MPSLLLILALQAAAATAPAPAPKTAAPERFSILRTVPNEPCVRKPTDDIVVCGEPLQSQKLPDDYVPDGPVPSNKYLTGSGALAAQDTPCAVRLGGCQVGFGPPLVPIIKGVAGVIGNAFRKKPDKTGRVPIPLDDTPPTGRVEP